MKALRIPFFMNADDIIKRAEKHSKHKKFAFAQFLDGSIRLIFNGTVCPPEEDTSES